MVTEQRTIGAVHCGQSCEGCSHWPVPGIDPIYPPREYCEFADGGILYSVIGDCNRCGICCSNCSHLLMEREGFYECKIYEDRPHACREFPTVQDFLENNVPNGCGFSLAEQMV